MCLKSSSAKRKGKTIILVEHKIDRIAEYADRVLVMDGGQIVMDGSAQEILSDPTLLNYGINVPEISMLGLKLRESGYDLPQVPHHTGSAETLIGTRERATDMTALELKNVKFAYPNWL